MKKIVLSMLLSVVMSGVVFAQNIGPSWLYSDPQYSNQVAFLATITNPDDILVVQKNLIEANTKQVFVLGKIAEIQSVYAKEQELSNLNRFKDAPVIVGESGLKQFPSLSAKLDSAIKTLYANDPVTATKAAVYYGCASLVKSSDIMNLIYIVAQGPISGSHLYTLRGLRSRLNARLLEELVAKNRKAGNKTVGIVIPEYKAVIDAQNSGSNMVNALKAVGLTVPAEIDWDAGIADAKARIAKIMSGEQMQPTDKDIAIIEMYLGVDGLRKFTEDYNKL